MSYTVQQLAKLSGVSVRTLHWYDKKGLLNPVHRGDNGYRYYQEQQLLTLQQILFFKELGFNLNDIQKLLQQKDFDHVNALAAHKQHLLKEIKRKQHLITTIDNTIQHLRGKYKMQNKELYYGFNSEKQKQYENYMVENYNYDEARMLQSKQRTAKWDKKKQEQIKLDSDAIYKELAGAIEQNLSPTCDQVQAIIARHCQLINQFYDVTADVYVGLTQTYKDNSDFAKFFDHYHPEMIDYIGEAMRYYAKHNL